MRWKAEENLPPLDFLDDDERARLVELSTHARYRRALLHEADAWRAGAASLPSLGYDFGDTPLIVLSQDTNYPPSDDEETKARKAVWAELQAELAGLSENSELIVVEETGHLIPIFAPKAVVEAAETMLER
ncbi:MAG: hypothetical protein Tsb0010_07140 [Parvularculaceae bacterium]